MPVINVLIGPDRWLTRAALSAILVRLDPSGENTSKFESPADSLSTVATALATRTFFAEARVVVATGYLSALGRGAAAKSKKNRPAEKSSSGGELESLVAIAETSGELIFFEPEMSALPAAAKTLLPATANVALHAPPRGSAFVDFAQASARERGATIDRQATQHMLNRLFPGYWQQVAGNPAFDRPPDIELLMSELDKLATAAGAGAIDEHLIDALTPTVSHDHVFSLLDAVIVGNAAGALREIETLPHSGDEITRTVAMIGQQIEFAAAAVAQGRPGDLQVAGKAVGMPNPNRMKAVLNVASPAASRQPRLIEDAVDADRRLKSGLDSTPEDTLYRLITRSRASGQQ